jgi:sporulation protein YlmC with PRC-barrel domain
MRLSELIGREVVTVDGESLGVVHDALLVQDGPILRGTQAAFRLHALAVGRRAWGTQLGFRHGGVDRPWLLKKLLGRAPTMVQWTAVTGLGDRIVVDLARSAGSPR